jgi:hypothetical protein
LLKNFRKILLLGSYHPDLHFPAYISGYIKQNFKKKIMKHIQMFEAFSMGSQMSFTPEDISKPGDSVFCWNIYSCYPSEGNANDNTDVILDYFKYNYKVFTKQY